MKLSIQSDQDDVVRVEVTGKITQQDVSPFIEPLGDKLGPGAYSRKVLLDMRGVEVLDSSGIGWLLVCHKRFRNAGGLLVLHSLSPLAQNVLRVLNMQSVFRLARDESEAEQLLQGDQTK